MSDESVKDEVLTVACEYVHGVTRSDAQGMVEAMPESRKDFILKCFSDILKTHSHPSER